MTTYPKLKTVEADDDYKLNLAFENGEKRIYDFKPNLTHKFYKPLSDVTLFKKVSIVDNEIQWASGQDFCPHTLYEKSIPQTKTISKLEWEYEEEEEG
jgi:hypothetical protein